MTIQTLAQAVDSAAMAFAFGATAWFFFVQSPVLLAKQGREKFVPLQMKLTIVLFNALTIALAVAAGATALHSTMGSPAMLTAGVALAAVLANKLVVVPRALRAGGRSRRDLKGLDHEGSTAAFASEGAGAKTKTMHRLVVLFVVVMLGGVVGHGATLVGA